MKNHRFLTEEKGGIFSLLVASFHSVRRKNVWFRVFSNALAAPYIDYMTTL
jgi:hypothetical protein